MNEFEKLINTLSHEEKLKLLKLIKQIKAKTITLEVSHDSSLSSAVSPAPR